MVIGRPARSYRGGDEKTPTSITPMSVIVSRALPDVRDGLKPGIAASYYAMSDLWARHYNTP